MWSTSYVWDIGQRLAAVGLGFVAFGAIFRLHGLCAAHVGFAPPVTGLEQDGNASTCKQGGHLSRMIYANRCANGAYRFAVCVFSIWAIWACLSACLFWTMAILEFFVYWSRTLVAKSHLKNQGRNTFRVSSYPPSVPYESTKHIKTYMFLHASHFFQVFGWNWGSFESLSIKDSRTWTQNLQICLKIQNSWISIICHRVYMVYMLVAFSIQWQVSHINTYVI